MKYIAFSYSVFLVLFLNPAFCQLSLNTPGVSLRQYCPLERGQYGATCFAYAPVYTALSIMENIKDSRTDEKEKAANAFSDCYVASMLNKTNRFWIRTTSCCGRNGTYLKTLEFLKVNGTCKINEFKKSCVKKNKSLKKHGPLHKIKNYEVYEDAWKYIYHNNGQGGNYTSKAWIIEKLNNKTPVIVAPYQVSSFSNLKKEEWVPTLAEKNEVKNGVNANHVVCIVGYGTDKDGVVYFEVRNNYLNWGKDNFAFVKADDFLLFVQEAAVIE